MNTTRSASTLRPPRIATAILAIILACAGPTLGGGPAAAPPNRPLIAYWAFNCFTTCGDANLQPEPVGIAPASMTSSFEPDAGVNESGTTLNALPLYEARAAMTLRTGTGGINNGRSLTWWVSTAGTMSLTISFAARRSAAGFNSNQFQYTLDGSSFVDFGAPFDPGSQYAVVSYDLRRVRSMNDNPNVGFRIVFNGGSTTSDAEFVAIDNLKVAGK